MESTHDTTVTVLLQETSETSEEFERAQSLVLSHDQRAFADRIQKSLRFVLVALSVPLTLCNIAVFAHKDMRSATGIYVIGLSVGQLFYIVSNTIYAVWTLAVENPLEQVLYCWYVPYVSIYGGVLVAKRASYVIMCVASVERLYAVLRPLHVKEFLLSKRPGLCLLLIYGTTAAWHAYYLAKSKMILVEYRSTGTTVCRYVSTQLYLDTKQISDAVGRAATIVLTYISLSLQLVVNVLTVWALRRHNAANKHVQSSANEEAKRRQERQLTVTLLGASVSYVMLSLPAALVNLIPSVAPEVFSRAEYPNLYRVIGDFCFNLTVLGCGVDFFCYMALSSKYRKTSGFGP
nr:hypothetical protein BaRGS_031905 [Batillaria attramentaria]